MVFLTVPPVAGVALLLSTYVRRESVNLCCVGVKTVDAVVAAVVVVVIRSCH